MENAQRGWISIVLEVGKNLSIYLWSLLSKLSVDAGSCGQWIGLKNGHGQVYSVID